MENITYLFGAGASRNCLPVVSEMSDRIIEVCRKFQHQLNHYGALGSKLNKEVGIKIIEDLNWLSDICDVKKNFSVDTYAKKLLLAKKDEEYDKLKNILTLYFTLQQKYKLPDIRYDNFWASLLNESNNFPKNIKILSWNYDFQMEATYQEFINSDSLTDSAKNLNIITQKNINSNSNVKDFKYLTLMVLPLIIQK
jgi:hypothetical protein